jgi:nitrogen fixation NifU-like protein
MSDLRELYQEMILAHSRAPRNYREMEPVDRRVDGFNPLCGDRITVFLRVEDGTVVDASFQGAGCAISVSSASMMTEAILGRPVEEVEATFTRFHDLVTGEEEGDGGDLGKLKVFGGVREFPDRVKCAILGWHAMHAALSEEGSTVTTE